MVRSVSKPISMAHICIALAFIFLNRSPCLSTFLTASGA